MSEATEGDSAKNGSSRITLRRKKPPTAWRRRPQARILVVLLALVMTGSGYALAASQAQAATTEQSSADQTAEGYKLFAANCTTCHGSQGQGSSQAPSLVGVGAAAVDFQVGTGRMPMQATGPQAPSNPQVTFTDEEIKLMAAYVATLGPGPAIPDSQTLTSNNADISAGKQLFITNCAMCHNFAGKGGVLTRGKWAPSLDKTSDAHLYEAMATGPQSMPVFNDKTMTPQDKRNIIAYLKAEREEPSPGGLALGSIGPVSEGLLAWIVGLGLLIGCAVWLGAKSS